MRIWRFHEPGSLDNLQLDEMPVPEPGAGEVLLKVERAALNPADAFLIEGKYPRPGKPPLAVGRDGCGVIEKALDGGRYNKGDRVILLRSDVGVTRNGTLADYVTVPEASLAPLPEGWSPEEGAAAPLVFLTAYQALLDVGGLLPGHTALITGASGGVGTAAVMLGRAYGALVVALSRSEENRQRLLELGADVAVDASAPDMEEQVKKALGGGRVDVVVENVAGPFLQKSIDLLREKGRIAVVGLLAGLTSEIVIGKLLFKRARIEGVQVGSLTAAEAQEAWIQIVKRLNSINARPVVDRVFPMDKVPDAFQHLRSGVFGKVVVDVQT